MARFQESPLQSNMPVRPYIAQHLLHFAWPWATVFVVRMLTQNNLILATLSSWSHSLGEQ